MSSTIVQSPMRIRAGCSIKVGENFFAEGTEINERQLHQAIEEVPPLELRLREMASSEYVEIRDADRRLVIREVKPETYAEVARAASFEVDPHGALKLKTKEFPGSDGTERFQALLDAPETSSPRIRRNGFFAGIRTDDYAPAEG